MSADNTKLMIAAITQGDVNGIGYEVILKSLSDQRILEFFTPVIYGNSKALSYHKKLLSNVDYPIHVLKNTDQAHPKKSYIINVSDEEIKIDLGKVSKHSGDLAHLSLEKAIQDLKDGKADFLVTAPIHKKAIQSESYHFPGHTEYLASKFDVSEYMMIMVAENMRIGVATGHIPLNKITETITSDLLFSKLKIFDNSLQRDFNISRPRIAVLSINPHAGDEGVIGTEEAEIIAPAIRRANENGMEVFGPFASDAFFGNNCQKKYDGVLAMYHDQGLMPFKMLAYENGVNYTAGLPIVRTSPAHGTAFDIAGQDKASFQSFREALWLAAKITQNRKDFDDAHSNPLKK